MYKRVLLKLSGEALSGNGNNFDPEVLSSLALELKEKITADDFEAIPDSTRPVISAQNMQEDAFAEALLALQSLGYSNGEAVKALGAVRGQSDKADELVRLALRSMM